MRAAFARASGKSTSKDRDQNEVSLGGGGSETRSLLNQAGASSATTTKGFHNGQNQHQVKVKVKSASVESNHTIPSVRCSSLNFYDEDASTSEASSQTGSGVSEKKRASSQESLKQRPSSLAKGFLSISPLRPSLSTSCLFSSSSSGAADETSKDCDSTYSGDGGREGSNRGSNARSKQQSSSALICIPTRASLTHEWRKLKTPNKCRECNLLVYFNGRECSMCGFVAHKKCITVLVIKCHRKTSQHAPDHRHNSNNNKQLMPNVTQATAQSMGGIGAALFSLRNQNIRPLSNLASPYYAGDHTHPGARPHNPIFGQSIGGIDSEQVLDFINRFVYEIDTRGLTSRGIYRVSSIKSKVDKLCNYYDQNPSNLIDLSSFHPNIIANALKMYLRRLPEPLLTNKLYDRFIGIARRHNSTNSSKSPKSPNQIATTILNESQPQADPPDDEERNTEELLAEFKEVVEQLPATNRELAAIIMRHLRRVADMAEENQMSSKNLSIIFGPTLLSAGEHKSSIAIADNIHQARLVELMIDWAYQIFPHSRSSPSREPANSDGDFLCDRD